MKKDRAVLFDLGNVLVQIHPEAFGATLGVSESERGQYRPGVISATQRYERGELTTDEYFADLSGIFEGRFARPKLEEAMRNVIGEPIIGMAELLEKTASVAEVALVSNTNEFHFEYCIRQFSFLSHVPRRYLSYRLRSLKPDPKYYIAVTAGLGIPASKSLFVDDLAENIEGARNAGMKGHCFREINGLLPELHSFTSQ
ncbi:MAG: HAD-IA family hydrolase [Bacteroidota bacterium]